MLKKEKSEKKELQIFVQGEGIEKIQLIRIDEKSTLLEIAGKLSPFNTELLASPTAEKDLVFLLEDSEKELSPNTSLKELGIKNRKRIHIHRCRKVDVTVNFNGKDICRKFPVSKTIAKIKRWADRKFKIEKTDAHEHALQICGTDKRPSEDVHIGTLVTHGDCQICFDLVPKQRVEG